MTNPSIIIIGAGIAGLSAGIYGQMNGFKTQIFELHSIPGGVCTAWKRKGYTIDGCIHWLIGSNPNSGFYEAWKAIGALNDEITIINHDAFNVIEDDKGNTFTTYTNIDKLEEEMLRVAPEDEKEIRKMARDLRKMTTMDMPVTMPKGLQMIPFGIKMMPAFSVMNKYASVPMKDYVNRFSNDFLRYALKHIIAIEEFPASSLFMTLAMMNNENAGYPLGGSLPFAQRMAEKYSTLGGKIDFRTRIKRILVENDRAIGIECENGTCHYADYVISAADGHSTIYKMLEGKYTDDEINHWYNEMKIFDPMTFVNLGVNRDLSKDPHLASFCLKKPFTESGKEHKEIGYKHYCYDPAFAPEGKSIVQVLISANYDYWKEIEEEPERYNAEKKRVAEAVITALEERWPGLNNDIEMVDVATPLTMERYTANWRGSYEGWEISPETMKYMVSGGLKKNLPG